LTRSITFAIAWPPDTQVRICFPHSCVWSRTLPFTGTSPLTRSITFTTAWPPDTQVRICFPPFLCVVAHCATRYTTGLGLPLSRALANSGNGWLGLEDTCPDSATGPASLTLTDTHGLPVTVEPSKSTRIAGPGDASQPPQHIVTQYWCVMEAETADEVGALCPCEGRASVGVAVLSQLRTSACGQEGPSPHYCMTVLDSETPVFAWILKPRPLAFLRLGPGVVNRPPAPTHRPSISRTCCVVSAARAPPTPTAPGTKHFIHCLTPWVQLAAPCTCTHHLVA
jgi:hypothetical protein